MDKVPKQSRFIKSFEHLLTGKLTAREVLIYGIIYQFEINKTPCFISRQELAKRINESEATAERALQLLIKEGYIVSRRKGRKRYLSTSYPQENNLYQVDTSQTSDLYQKEGQSVSKQGADLYQVDTLTRSITRSINKINKISTNDHKSTNYVKPKKDKTMPEPLFENFWNGLTAEDRQEFIKQAKGKLTGLKAKLATGQDGFAKMLVLQEYWLKEEAASLVVDNSVENEVYNF